MCFVLAAKKILKKMPTGILAGFGNKKKVPALHTGHWRIPCQLTLPPSSTANAGRSLLEAADAGPGLTCRVLHLHAGGGEAVRGAGVGKHRHREGRAGPDDGVARGAGRAGQQGQGEEAQPTHMVCGAGERPGEVLI